MASSKSTADPTAGDEKQHKSRWLALFMLALALLMSVVDASVVSVATPAIQKEFNATDAQMLMVVAAYTVMFAATLILFGKLAANEGMRLYQLIGVALFGLASLAVGLAPNVQFMVVMRAVEGTAAAMIGATGLALVNIIFSGKDRNMAFAVWGTIAGLGAAVGPLLGGWAVTNYTWRLAFFINVPIAILVVFGVLAWVVEVKRKGAGAVDLAGAAIIGVGLLGIIVALIYGPTLGWWDVKAGPSILGTSLVPWVFLLGVLLIGLAYPEWDKHLEDEKKEPIFDLGLFKFGSFRGGMATALARQIAQYAPSYALSIYLQKAAGWSAQTTGLVFVAAAAGAMVGGPLSGSLANRFGTKWVVAGGIVGMLVSIFWMLAVVGTSVTAGVLILPLLLYGLGTGMAASQLNTVVMTDVPKPQSGEASAAKSAIRQVGNSFGTAFVGILLAISIGDVFVLAIIMCIVALGLSFTLPNIRGGGGGSAKHPAEESKS